ncbi:hypothetical protein AAG906_006681 [Vitis piasezkii]
METKLVEYQKQVEEVWRMTEDYTMRIKALAPSVKVGHYEAGTLSNNPCNLVSCKPPVMEVASHAYSLGSLMVDWLNQVKKLVQVWHLAQYVHETHKTALTEEYVFTLERMIPIAKSISFIETDLLRTSYPHEDTLVLKLNVANIDVCQILINQVSWVTLLHVSTNRQMYLTLAALEHLGRSLTRFNGSTVVSLGYVILLVIVGSIIMIVHFSGLEDPSPSNAILRRAWIHKIKAILSTYY